MSASARRTLRQRLPTRLVMIAFLALGGIAPLLVAPSAQAQDAGQEPMKVLVGQLSGAKTTSARGWIVEGLAADPRFEVVGSNDGSELKAGANEGAIAEAAATLQADAVILGASRFGRGWSAELEIYDGKDGHLIQKVPVKGGSYENYESNIKSGADYFSVVAGAEGFPPPPPEPVELDVDDEEEEAPVEEAAPVEEEGGAPSPLDISAGIRLYSRSFRYTDTLEQLAPGSYDPLIDYNLAAGPMPLLHLNWYPGAHFGDGFASHIGVAAGYEMGIATSVIYEDETGAQQKFKQSHNLWYAGLRGRIPVSMVTLGLGANYGGHNFAVKSESGGGSAEFPAVSYSFVDINGDIEFKVGSLFLGVNGGYLALLGLGEIAEDAWFPNAKAKAVHVGGHVGWGLSPAVDVLAGVETRFYGFNFNPVEFDRPDDRVAGGATDRYLSASLALRFRIPEKSGAASGDSSGGEAEGAGSFDSFD